MKAVLIPYVVCAILAATWNDAMETRCRAPGEHAPWAAVTAIAMLWPVTVPASIALMTWGGDGHRWSRCFVASIHG